MSDVVRCLGCGARFKVADAAKVERSKVQCRKCGGELQAEQAAAVDHGGDDYDFKPSAAVSPAAAARARTSVAAAASTPVVVVAPAVSAKSIRKVYTDADLATDEDTESFWGRNKKLIIAIASAVVPIVLAVVIGVTYTGGKKKRGGSAGVGGAVAAAASNANKAAPAAPAAPLLKPAMGIWPLPAGPGPKGKGKLLDGNVQLVARTDLPPRGMLFTGRDIGQVVIVSSLNDFAGCWLDRYDLASGKPIGSVEMPNASIGRGRVTDLSQDGSLLLTAGGRHLDLWSIESDKGVKAADVELVGLGVDPESSPVWSGIAAPDIVLVLVETQAGDKLMSFMPRPTSAPPVDLGTAQGENERKRDMRWSADAVQTFVPRFTPDRRMVAYWNDGAVQFADPATGKVVSTLPSQSNRAGTGIAFDETCTRAAVVWRDLKVGFLSIYDLKTGQSVADFPLTQADTTVAPRRWLGKDHVLLDDGSVIDVQRGAPVWRYEYASRLIHAVPHPDERFWFMVEKPKGETSVLAVKSLPTPDEVGAGTGDAAGAFVATKGMQVAVQMEMTGPSEAADAFRRRLQGKVEARLKQFGMVPTAGATATLKVRAVFVETGDTAEVRNAYGAGKAETIKLRTLSGSIVLNDGAGAKAMKLKDFAVGTPAHDKMPLKAGKSPEDILHDMQWDNLEGEIDDFAVPGYLTRTSKAVRSSKLEP